MCLLTLRECALEETLFPLPAYVVPLIDCVQLYTVEPYLHPFFFF